MTDIAKLVLAVDSTQVTRGGRSLDGLASSGQRAERSAGRMRSAFSGLATVMRTLLPMVSAVALVMQFRDAISQQELLQRNMMRTQQLLETTGASAWTTADNLHQQARQIAATTLQSVEGMMQAQQVLLTFSSIAGQTFDRTLNVATDMASVLGTDVSSAVRQLGRALEDPATGLTMLTRAGISFNDEQKEMIRSMMELGQHAEAQNFILGELEKRYSGVAVAEAQGLAGAWDSLSQALQEAKIAVADWLSAGDGLARIVNWISDGVNEFTAIISSGQIDAYLDFWRFQFAELGRDIRWVFTRAREFIDVFWQDLMVNSGKVMQFVAGAFRDFVPNVRAAIQLATVEIAAFVDRAFLWHKRLVQYMNPMNWFGGGSVNEDYRREIEAIEGALDQSRQAIFAERDAHISRGEAILQNGQLVRDEWDRQGQVFIPHSERIIGGRVRETSAIEDLVKAQDQLRGRYEAVRGALDPAWRLTQDYTRTLGVLHQAWQDGRIDGEQYVDLLWELEGKMEDVADTANATAAEMSQGVNPFMAAWESAIQRIDGLFVDLWESGLRSFRDFSEQLKNTFRRLLAEMAHAAMTRPIVVGLAASMPGAAQAGIQGTGGVGGLSSLFGGNQIGMGFQGAGDWLFSNTSLPVGNLMQAGQISNMAFGAAGLLGGLGANMLFGGRGQSGLGGGLGSMAGLALGGPVGAALGGLLGGGIGSIFGGKPSNRAAMSDIDLATGGLLGLDQMRGDKAPSQETLQARDAITEAIIQAVGGISALGGTTGGRLRLDVGERDAIQVDVGEGLIRMGETMDEALANIVDLLIERSEGMDEAFASLIRGIESGEGRVRMTTALGMIQGLRGGDSVGMGRDAIAARDMTLTASFREQTQAVDQLIRTYDGSLEATETLAEAYATQRAVAVELAVVLDDASRAISAMFADTSLRIRESLMGEQELYEFRRSRTHDLVDQLQVSDDAQQIQMLTREIDQLVNTLWGSLDEVQRGSLGTEFLGFLEDADRLAQDRLGAIRDEISEADAHLADSAQRTLEAASMQIEAANTMQQAANMMMQAAQTPIRISTQGGEVHTR